jgi:hypothetical protein
MTLYTGGAALGKDAQLRRRPVKSSNVPPVMRARLGDVYFSTSTRTLSKML